MKQPFLISYLKLRGAIGLIGVIFPLVIIFTGNVLGGCPEIQESMSAYYFNSARDFFVGMLFTIGILFLVYRGYDRRDNILANISGFSAIGIALLPTNMGDGSSPCDLSSAYDMPTLHYLAALTFFISLIVFSMVQFPKTDPDKPPTSQKLKRNKLYKTCGWIMIASLTLMILNKLGLKFISKSIGLENTFTFVTEWIFLSAFGISWITKGEYLFKDQ